MKIKCLLISLIIIIYLGNFVLSLFVFCNGFLIRRLSLNDTNTKLTGSNIKLFNRTIVLLVDALRFDFIFSAASRKNIYNQAALRGDHDDDGLFGLPTIEGLLKTKPSQSKLFKFIADPPTTTMQRIKGLMTGSLPTFIDIGSNFDSYLIEDDSLIRQAYLHNRSVIVLGDDTWLSLFEAKMLKAQHTYPSFNIKDLDTNDLNVDEKLRFYLNKRNSNLNYDWHLMIAHLLGVDHCGHTFGPKSMVLKRKLRDVDNTIKLIVDSIADEQTLLVVIGDHGMTETGDHGGDSRLELESALFFYSRRDLFANARTQIYKAMPQINLTPTLALLLGLPIPFSNLGVVIEEVFKQQQNVNDGQDLHLAAIKANFIQMNKFIKKYQSITNEQFMENADTQMSDLLRMINENKHSETNQLREKLAKFLNDVQQACRQKWSTFNMEICLLGIFLMALSILVLTRFIHDLQYSAFILNDQNVFYFYLAKLRSAFVCSLIYAAYSFFLLSGGSVKQNLIDSIWLYLIMFGIYDLTVSFSSTTIHFNIRHLAAKASQLLASPEYLIFLLVLLIPFSNSFIIRENKCIQFMLISLLFLDAYKRLRHLKLNTNNNFSSSLKKLALQHGSMILLTRLAFVFFLCREEVAADSDCQQTIFSIPSSKIASSIGSSSSSTGPESLVDLSSKFLMNHYLIFILLNFFALFFLFEYLLSKKLAGVGDNTQKSLNVLYVIQIIMLFFYLNLQHFSAASTASNEFTKLNEDRYRFLLIYSARFYYLLFLVQQFLIFSATKSPSNKRLLNFMISFTLFISILIDQTLLSVWMLFVFVLNYADSLNDNNEDFGGGVDINLMMLLAQSFFFYASGHETTFTHIKWESGFHGFDGDNNNHLIRLIKALLIILNTFCSNALVSTCGLAMITKASASTKHKDSQRKEIRQLVGLLRFYKLFAVKILFGAISVFLLRRHLMVWKIFAPRFCLESIGLILTFALSLLTNYLL